MQEINSLRTRAKVDLLEFWRTTKKARVQATDFTEVSIKKTPQQQIGENIRVRRCIIGLSQQQLANAVGLRRQAIGLIEKGRQTLPAEYVVAIATALQCDPASLLKT